MKKILILGLIVVCATGGVVGFKHYKSYRNNMCVSWLTQARAAEHSGYHAKAIEHLTLYFSEADCRGKNDPAAIETFSVARLNVPIPGGGEVAQQLSLSRVGWRLGRNPEFQLMQAKAALAIGDWHSAAELASYSRTGQSVLIRIAALVRMKDWAELQTIIDELDQKTVSPFQRSLLSTLLVNSPVTAPAGAARPDLEHLARHALRGGTGNIKATANSVKSILTDDDLTVATTLLTAAGEYEVVIELLDQPRRSLPSGLLKRLAFQFWSTSNHRALMNFPVRNSYRPLKAEVLLLMCLAERELTENCSIKFDEMDYGKRYGRYAAQNWSRLFKLLNDADTPAHTIVDALVSMVDLVKTEPAAYQLLASLYGELDETELEARFTRTASMFGLAPSGNWQRSPAPSWTERLSDGFRPTKSQVELLEDVSPDQATLWRLAKSHLALSEANDEGAAEALRIVRPVLSWAPEVAAAQLIAASSTAHFGDYEASFGHLMTAVKSDAKSAVAALRLSLHFYKQQNGLSATELHHWWETISRAEVSTTNPGSVGPKIRQLLVDRSLILAAIAEEEQDEKLARNAYWSVLKEEPSNHIAMNNLAVWLAKDDRELEKAKQLAKAAVALDPEQAEYRLTLEDINRAMEGEARD